LRGRGEALFFIVDQHEQGEMPYTFVSIGEGAQNWTRGSAMKVGRQANSRCRILECAHLDFLSAVFVVLVLMDSSWSTAVAQDRAQLEAEMNAEFDARTLSAAEKMVLQLGLTLDGTYVGLLDGRWGPGSQSAAEDLAVRTDPQARADGLVRNYHVAYLASRAIDFIVQYDLSYRSGPPWGHRFLAPPGRLLPDPETPSMDDLILDVHGINVTMITSKVEMVLAIHAGFSQELVLFSGALRSPNSVASCDCTRGEFQSEVQHR
jgi:hypothetical protein